MDEGNMPWSGEYSDSKVRRLNTHQGAAEELQDLIVYRIGNRDRVSLFVMGDQCFGPNSFGSLQIHPQFYRFC